MSSLVFDKYHYIKNGDGREELYDIESDRAEAIDLTRSEKGRQMLNRFRADLKSALVGNHGLMLLERNESSKLSPR
jgi:hypothetical protein